MGGSMGNGSKQNVSQVSNPEQELLNTLRELREELRALRALLEPRKPQQSQSQSRGAETNHETNHGTCPVCGHALEPVADGIWYCPHCKTEYVRIKSLSDERALLNVLEKAGWGVLRSVFGGYRIVPRNRS